MLNMSMYNPEVRPLLSKDVFRPSYGSEPAGARSAATTANYVVLFRVKCAQQLIHLARRSLATLSCALPRGMTSSQHTP